MTIAEVLRDAGYLTAMTGKCHQGQHHGTPPWTRGFMRSLNSRYGEVYSPREADRVEQRDLAAEKPQLVADMAAAWRAWAERTFVDEWSEPGPPKP